MHDRIAQIIERHGGTLFVDSEDELGIIFKGPLFNDEVLAQIGSLSEVVNLSISEGSITPRGLAKWLPRRTRSIGLHGLNFGDEFAEVLAQCAYVESISLNDTSVSDVGVQSLGIQNGLRELFLAHTLITDRAGDFLVNFAHLKALWLSETRIGNRLVARLAGPAARTQNPPSQRHFHQR